ncbi:MAG TPA: alpha/beta hydrolase [Rhabdochlamydiaceae bacterium]|jgi:esterase FrsA
MRDSQRFKSIATHSDISLSFIGPDLQEGPLPALFYFALSAHESLGVDPYNQPVVYLSQLPLRIFSIDLPFHGEGLSAKEALKHWAENFHRGKDLLSACVERSASILEELIAKHIIAPQRCAVAGLSRGALIATHVAARCKEVRWILGFAPLTKLSYSKDFREIKNDPSIDALSIEHLTPLLTHRIVRFYIGNCDQLVSTRYCFDFIEKLAKEMRAAHIHSPSAELFIKPSIGFQGHGTSKQTFHEGAQWLAEQLGIIDVH